MKILVETEKFDRRSDKSEDVIPRFEKLELE
jgi:hypothetical protein